MIPCICIFGPTASGKSALAFRLCRDIGGTIISADSMQIYRGMDIGTAKPTKEERLLVAHKMIDFLDPGARYSVFDYQAAAEREICAAWARGSVPVVVGGTGLYIDALLFHTDFGDVEISPAVADDLKKQVEEGHTAALLEELKSADPETAASLHIKDVKRIVRALAVYRSTGKTLSSFKRASHNSKGEIEYLPFCLCFRDRGVLYDRIEKRVDSMVREGLIEETRDLFNKGALDGTTASQAIGYKELLPYLSGEKALADCLALLKQKTRNFAKRQITWFKRYQFAVPLYMDDPVDPYPILKERSVLFLKEYES